tara:strand:+ start:600 stop:1028 length:429 start_codon:yes stop_codon:yes gene_type:complete
MLRYINKTSHNYAYAKTHNTMENYIDGFVLPVPRIHLDEYKEVAKKVAEIWKEYGALAYFEYLGEDLKLEGTRSFVEAVDLKEEEAIVFGWVVFPSKEIRDRANKQVPNDSRMADLVAPLIDPDRLIFDAERMVYGGFQSLV